MAQVSPAQERFAGPLQSEPKCAYESPSNLKRLLAAQSTRQLSRVYALGSQSVQAPNLFRRMRREIQNGVLFAFANRVNQSLVGLGRTVPAIPIGSQDSAVRMR
jgi:hypothetical protein